VRRFLFENGLSLFFGSIFLLTLVGQSFAGQHAFNAEQAEHGGERPSWLDDVLSPDFGGDVMENWQSEFLPSGRWDFTIYLRQRGSSELKPVGAPHDEAGSSG
jgi:hypothetical protein